MDTIKFGEATIPVTGYVLVTPEGEAVEFDSQAQADLAATVFGGTVFPIVSISQAKAS